MPNPNISSHLWQLDSKHCSVLLQARGDETPALVWFGSAIGPATGSGSDNAAVLQAMTEAPALLASPDQSPAMSLLPMASNSTLAMPALLGHAAGQHFSPRFKRRSAHKHSTETAEQLELVLEDVTAKLEITLLLSLHKQSNVLSISNTLKNNGVAEFELQWLASATLPLTPMQNELLSFHGRWGLEMQAHRGNISSTRIQIENNAGRSSHQHFPGAVAGPTGFDESASAPDANNLLGVQLAWSGNHRLLAEQMSDGCHYLQAGALLQPGEVKLASGQSWQAPAAHIVAASGLNQLSQRYHQFARQEVLPGWTRTPRPVHANSWEALYFNHDMDELTQLVDAAAEIGAERFVLDDGWFRHRRDDTAGLGDWFVDTSVYPQGLHPLVKHVHDRGMQFGLWFEPEMVNPDSDLYRQHPDWALHAQGYATPLARQQLALNLARTDVFDYLYDCMSALLEEYPIDYIKWDMNRNLVLAGDGKQSVAAQQPVACYRLMQKLQQNFPALEIESCSSGGARADLGVLAHCGRVWSSDNIDPVERSLIQRGFSTFLPAEILGVHVGSDKAHLTGRHTNIHLRAIVALQGQYGFEFDARKLNPQERQILHHYTCLYKDNRQWLAEATHWRLPFAASNLIASGNVSQCQSRSLWQVIRLQADVCSLPGRLVLQGLQEGAMYRVKYEALNTAELASFALALPAWMTQELLVPADLLMRVGLQLPVMPAQSGLLFSCSKAD